MECIIPALLLGAFYLAVYAIITKAEKDDFSED